MYNQRMFGISRRTYLDVAAGTTGNPSSSHEEGRRAHALLEKARTQIARLTEVKPDDVIFSSGATEANALAILGYGRALLRRGSKPHLLYLESSHASVVENAKMLAREGASIETLPLADTRVDVVALKDRIREETALVVMDAVCGETGVVWNTREVRQALDAARAPGEPRILLHVDASQAPRTEKISRGHFGADLLTFDGSKIGAPRGIGCLIAHRTIPLEPLFGGGGQERALVPGSQAPELAMAFAQALQGAAAMREAFRVRALSLREFLITSITESIPHVYINEGKSQAPQILNISLPGRDTDYLVILLDKAGFAVSTRSACETDSLEGSRAVFALFGDAARAKSTLRISWGLRATRSTLRRFVRALAQQVAFIDRGVDG